MQLPLNNSVLITDNLDSLLASVKQSVSVHNLRIFGEVNKQFTIDISRKVILESTVTSYDTKYIILLGISFNIPAQNSLLKLLEESPKNTIILILVSDKQQLLSTVISRLHIHYVKYNKYNLNMPTDTIDYLNMSDSKVTNLLLKHKRLKREDVAKIISDTIKIDGLTNRQSFTIAELDRLTNMLKLLNLNSNALNVFTAFLLILNTKYNSKNINNN